MIVSFAWRGPTLPRCVGAGSAGHVLFVRVINRAQERGWHLWEHWEEGRGKLMPAQAGSIPRDCWGDGTCSLNSGTRLLPRRISQGESTALFFYYFFDLTFPLPDPLAEFPEVMCLSSTEHPGKAERLMLSQLHSPVLGLSEGCWKETSP